MTAGFRASEVQIFRPYADEVPWELLAGTGVDEGVLNAVLELNFLRVAKHRGRVVGCYGIRPRSPLCYELVTLIVAEGYRRQGLGRWLIGHAIGLAETKGGREVVARRPTGDGGRAAGRFLVRMGFQPVDEELLRLELTPE